MLPDSPQPVPARDRKLATAFRSPATAALFSASIPGSKLPTCCFAFRRSAFTARSAFDSAPESGLLAGFPTASTSEPVAASAFRLAYCYSGLHSPSGLLHPYGSKRSARFAVGQPAFRTRPISVRSPLPVSITRISAADHRSRSATFPEACLRIFQEGALSTPAKNTT
jgi:hypothetical protein